MIIKIKPDTKKAQSLAEMAETTLERLERTDMEKYPSNTLVDYYDIIHKFMEAIASKKGIKIKGEGAHYELIEYVAQTKAITEKERLFLQQMREYRNRISYEGFMIHKNYISLHTNTIQIIIRHLRLQMG